MLSLLSTDYFSNTIIVSNSLDPDQDRHSVQNVCKDYQQMTSRR